MAAGKKKPEEMNPDTPPGERSLRDSAEEQLAHSPKHSPELKKKTSEQFIHELQVHQIELETQAEELRRAHIALEESRDKFLDLYDFAPTGYLTLTDKALIAEVNLAGATLLGVERRKLVNTRFRKFIAPEFFEQWDHYFTNLLKQEEKQTCTLTLKRSDGSTVPARMEGIRLTGSGGVTTVRIALSDITDIWEIEALRASEEQFHSMFERHDSVMLLIAPDSGKIIEANLAAARFYGRSQKELCSLSIDKINIMSPEEIAAARMKAARDQENFFTFSHRLASGEIRVVEVHSSPIDIGGKTVLFSIVNDITARRRTEEALKMSERKFRDTVKFFDEGYYSVTFEGQFLDHNPAFNRILDIDPAKDLKGERSIDFWENPDDRKTYMNELAMKGIIKNFEVQAKTINNRKIVVLLNSHIIRDKNNKPVRIDGTVSDVTDRKVAELELRESEEKYRILFNAESDAIFLVDKDTGSILDSNNAASRLYGYSHEEFIRLKNADLSAEPDETRKAITEQFIWIPLRYHKKKNGTVFPVEISGSRFLIKEREFVIAAIRDITERRAAEEALQLTLSRLESAMEAGNIAWWEMDCTTGNVTFSERKARMLGYPAEQFTHYTDFTRLLHPDDSEPAMQAMRDHLSGLKKHYEVEYRIRTRDGGYRWFHDIGRISTYGPDSKPLKVTGLVIDITERKRAEAAQEKTTRKLNVLSDLTRKDLTSQVFVLSGYLNLAKKHADDQDQVITTLSKGDQALRSIHEIIEYTKDYQDMGIKPATWQNVNLALLFGLSHVSIGVIQHSLETENIEIFADPLLEKVCQRLFENSLAHGGHVTRIRIWHTKTPDGITIFFEDDGIGIPQEKKEQIFMRGEGATRFSMRSLIFVREILDITGITIRETGEPGKGARFEIEVPNGAWRTTGKGD